MGKYIGAYTDSCTTAYNKRFRVYFKNHQSMVITDKDKLNSLNDQVTEWMGISQNKVSIWQMKCDKFVADIDNIIAKKYVM